MPYFITPNKIDPQSHHFINNIMTLSYNCHFSNQPIYCNIQPQFVRSTKWRMHSANFLLSVKNCKHLKIN